MNFNRTTISSPGQPMTVTCGESGETLTNKRGQLTLFGFTFQPLEWRDVRRTGPRIGSAPDNQELRGDCAVCRPVSQPHNLPVSSVHEVTEAFHAAQVTLGESAGVDNGPKVMTWLLLAMLGTVIALIAHCR